MRASWAAGGKEARYAVGDMPYVRRKLVVKEPTLCRPTAKQVRELMTKGAAGALFLTTDDIHRSVAELKARGVEFSEEPTEYPYGIDSSFRDPSGNNFRLAQLKPGFGG